MTIEGHELALCALNAEDEEARRQHIARLTPRAQVLEWMGYALRYAVRYTHEFDDLEAAGTTTFSPADILFAAAELAEHYEKESKE